MHLMSYIQCLTSTRYHFYYHLRASSPKPLCTHSALCIAFYFHHYYHPRASNQKPLPRLLPPTNSLLRTHARATARHAAACVR